ncbi:EF-hand calcium-binding domain-containing protein 14 [Larimichthys crocea]|uniref:Uncharacterized protein n=1 Tax=Larimichthys crocea TaxID=215358 RepID=A0ACD3QS85_LARCR|nr:EF-hand calcium-binding domain-containing protein 14 [Larimichthys crocea]
MKKRKELNALIGLGDSKRKKTKKGSGHRLLRTEPPDSESDSSSDDDEFNSLSSGANFGNVCSLLKISPSLIMNEAVRFNIIVCLLSLLQKELHAVLQLESSQKVSSSEIPKLSEDLKNKERKLDDIENGDKGLSKLWSNLTEMNRKSVATIGSTLTSVQHDVKTMQTVLENQKKDDDLKKTMDLTDLRKAVSEANKTEELHHTQADEQLHILLSVVADLRQRVSSLENGSKQSSKDNDATAQLPITSESPATEAVNEATTTKATPGDIQEISTPLTEHQASRRPRFSTSNRSKRNVRRCPKNVLLPGVSSLKDLEDVLHQAGIGRNSPGLTYSGLRQIFGTSTPSARTMECFDSDWDQKYSLKELRAALGL